MKIKKIISQHRRDFYAIFECEHCGLTHEKHGYDDGHFHNNVIPTMKCPQCGKTSSSDYRAFAPKYRDNEVI